MVIARNKEIAAEQLDQKTKDLKDIENQLREKQQQYTETVGEVILRGDELKQFVNTLRAKSNVYKQQRAQLAELRAEANDLQNTLDNLKAQDPSLSTINDDDPSSLEPTTFPSRPDSPIESRGMAELSRLVDGLTRAVVAAREKISPMSQQLRPLRERIAELKDECDSKKQVCTCPSFMRSDQFCIFSTIYPLLWPFFCERKNRTLGIIILHHTAFFGCNNETQQKYIMEGFEERKNCQGTGLKFLRFLLKENLFQLLKFCNKIFDFFFEKFFKFNLKFKS